MSKEKTTGTTPNGGDGGAFFFIIFIGLFTFLGATWLVTTRQNEVTRLNNLRSSIRLLTEDIEQKKKQLHNCTVSLEHYQGEHIKNFAPSLGLRPPHPGQLVIYDTLGRRVNDLSYGEDGASSRSIAATSAPTHIMN